MPLITLVGEGGSFVCRFRQSIRIPPNSSIAFKSITYDLATDDNYILDATNNEFRVRIATTGTWKTITIPQAEYTQANLISLLQTLLNASIDGADVAGLGFAWETTVDTTSNVITISYDRVPNLVTPNPLLSAQMSWTSDVLEYTGSNAPSYDGFAMLDQPFTWGCGIVQFTINCTATPGVGTYYFGLSNISSLVGLANYNPNQLIYGVEIVNQGATFTTSFLTPESGGAYIPNASHNNNVADTINLWFQLSDGTLSLNTRDDRVATDIFALNTSLTTNFFMFIVATADITIEYLSYFPLPTSFQVSRHLSLGATASVVSVDFSSSPVYEATAGILGFDTKLYQNPNQKAGNFVGSNPMQNSNDPQSFGIEIPSLPSISSYYSNASNSLSGYSRPIIAWIPSTEVQQNNQVIYEPRSLEHHPLGNDETILLDEVRVNLLSGVGNNSQVVETINNTEIQLVIS